MNVIRLHTRALLKLYNLRRRKWPYALKPLTTSAIAFSLSWRRFMISRTMLP